MSEFVFKLPDIGEGIAEAEIAEWHVAEGDLIEEDATLVDVLTDKAAVDISSPVGGKVLRLCGAAGDKVAVGAMLVVIETTAGAAAEVAKEEPAKAPEPAIAPANSAVTRPFVATKPPEEKASEAKASGTQKVLASPAVRHRAKEAGLDLSMVAGTGPQGRIRQADLDAALKLSASGGGSAPPSSAMHLPSAPSVRPPEQAQSRKIIGLRRKIAEAMTASYQRIPHFSYVEEVDVTELLRLRQTLNAGRKPEQPKLSLLPFLGLGLARVLPDFPDANAVYDEASGTLHCSPALHLGIATQTDQALMVPVVRSADSLDLWSLASAIGNVVDKARSGKANRDELSGSTITITSLGTLGGIASTPIINAPEVAIIGVNKLVERPV
ncbi:MAG: dihydrolipoamide acetyltransferase family protein, partial [Oceanococcaceae bacterium]